MIEFKTAATDFTSSWSCFRDSSNDYREFCREINASKTTVPV